MKVLFLMVALFFIQCGNIRNTVIDDNKYYPNKIGDTAFYLGSMNYQILPIQFDTTYNDTIYIVRECKDSISLHFKILNFVDVYGTVNYQDSLFSHLWESFYIKQKFEYIIDNNYFSSNLKFTFNGADSLTMKYINLHKEREIREEHIFKCKKLNM